MDYNFNIQLSTMTNLKKEYVYQVVLEALKTVDLSAYADKKEFPTSVKLTQKK